jgi:hypothetical protein
MGRPPLNLKETKVRLPKATKERIKALVGNYGIATFIREAVENELVRREGTPPATDGTGGCTESESGQNRNTGPTS